MNIEKLSNEAEKLRDEVLERRDHLMRTLGIIDQHKILTEQNDQLNELAQIVTYTRSGIDCELLNEEVTERLKALRFGKLHPKNLRPSTYN